MDKADYIIDAKLWSLAQTGDMDAYQNLQDRKQEHKLREML